MSSIAVPGRMKGCKPSPRHKLMRARNMFDFVASLPPPPDEFDSTGGFNGFQMFANDRLGDCVKAEDGNAALGLTFGATGTACTILEAEVVKDYFLETGGRDDGLDLATDMDWDNAHGLADASGKLHRPGPYGTVDATQIAEFAAACYYFKRLKLAIATPSSFMSSNDGDCLDWPPGKHPGAADHCVGVFGRKRINGRLWWKLVTWGGIRWVSDAWIIACCGQVGEAWATYKDADMFTVNGATVDGWDQAAMDDYWAVFSGAAPAPAPPGPNPPSPPRPCHRTLRALLKAAHAFQAEMFAE